MGWLEQYFDRVVVINLDRRPDRYRRFTRALSATDWPFRQPLRVPAVDGSAVGAPPWWKQGDGSWGCLMSHARVLEDAIRDGIERLLVLEDDAVFVNHFRERAERFLRHAPADWDQLYLGGVHALDPRKLDDDVYECVNVWCTHAYADCRAFMPRMYQHILNASEYIDHPGQGLDTRLGALHETGTVKAYAPAAWLVGQAAGASDVGHSRPRALFWNTWAGVPDQTLFVLLGLHEGGANAIGGLLQSMGVHFGHSLAGNRPPYAEDSGLSRICEQIYPFPATERASPVEETAAALHEWCQTILREAAVYGSVAAACYPQLCAMYEDMSRAWHHLKVIDVRSCLDESIAALMARSEMAADGYAAAGGSLAAAQRFLDLHRQDWLAHCEHLVVDPARLRTDRDALAAELRAFMEIRYEPEPASAPSAAPLGDDGANAGSQLPPEQAAEAAWTPLFETGVHAYYEGQIEAGREACERLLSLEGLPGPVRDQGRRNAIFYAPRLSELVPSAAISPVSFPVPDGWSRFNPSLASADDGYRLLVRSSNYVMEGNLYSICDGDGVIRTTNYLLSLGEDLAVRDVEVIDDRPGKGKTFPFPVVGFEDCRLVYQDGAWQAIATSREHNAGGVCQIVLLSLVDGAFREPRILTGAERHEKNWVPLISGGDLSFIYSFRPTVVLRYLKNEGRVAEVSRAPGPAIAEGFRGGSQAIELERGFLCLVHEVVWFEDGGRVYPHRFVLLDRNFVITHVSPQFFLLERGVEFCAGLALRGRTLTASFGFRDREAYLVSMDLEEALASLRPVGFDVEETRNGGPASGQGGRAEPLRISLAPPRQMVADQTLVSCFFDLERRERNGRRGADFYLQQAKLVLELPLPIVLYIEPDLVEWARTFRRERGLLALTEVVPRTLEELPLYRLSPGLASVPAFRNGDDRKDGPLHQIIGWSKLDLVAETMASNPFGTDCYAWIDFGVGHVARPPETPFRPKRRVSILQMRPVAPQEIEDRRTFYEYERGRLAGGFFGGHRDTLAELHREFLAELDRALALPARPNEQMILSYLSATRGDLFAFYYGDYASILTNWDGVRYDLRTVLWNIAHCRAYALWDAARRVCETALDSMRRGILAATADEQAELLDEAFVAAWYGQRPELAAEVRDAFLASCGDSQYFSEHRARILANFSLSAVPAGGEGSGALA